MGNELRAVVTANERWRRVEAGQLFLHGHHVLGLAASSHPDGQAETAVLIDHVQVLEPDMTPFIGPGAMRVGGYAAAA